MERLHRVEFTIGHDAEITMSIKRIADNMTVFCDKVTDEVVPIAIEYLKRME